MYIFSKNFRKFQKKYTLTQYVIYDTIFLVIKLFINLKKK